MPTLEKIVVSNFRNIGFQELEFASNVNCILGDNGQGKTNLLDSIYYLSMTKSAIGVSDSFICRHGQDSFSVCGTYRIENGTSTKYSISVGPGGEKKLRKDDKVYPRISSHIGEIPIVMVSPPDISLVSESGDERRKFANSVLSQMDMEYLDAAQQYSRLLSQRNKLLKEGNPDKSLLAVFNARMSGYADTIYNMRRNFSQQMKPVVSNFYNLISGGNEQVDIEYRSDLDKGRLEDILNSCADRDLAIGYTSAGVQRDDFYFTMNGHPIRRCGSQGQQKSFIVSLKFAQYEIMKQKYGFAPILLLDDVFDKLDMHRISNLLQMVSSSDFGQIFITDSSKVRLSSVVDNLTNDRVYYEASGGNFNRI